MERYAITGFVHDDLAKELKPKCEGMVEVMPERDAHDVIMRVSGNDITEVRAGSSARGQTLVQLLLRDGAQVETVVRTRADTDGVTRFYDPTITRLTASATVKRIEA